MRRVRHHSWCQSYLSTNDIELDPPSRQSLLTAGIELGHVHAEVVMCGVDLCLQHWFGIVPEHSQGTSPAFQPADGFAQGATVSGLSSGRATIYPHSTMSYRNALTGEPVSDRTQEPHPTPDLSAAGMVLDGLRPMLLGVVSEDVKLQRLLTEYLDRCKLYQLCCCTQPLAEHQHPHHLLLS